MLIKSMDLFCISYPCMYDWPALYDVSLTGNAQLSSSLSCTRILI